MKRMMLAAIFIISISACGNSNNSTSLHLPTLPSQDIRGTYELSSVFGSFLYSSGVVHLDDKNSVTGTLIIKKNTWNETYLADGTTYTTGDGTYSIVYNDGTTKGTISILHPNRFSSYEFTIDGYDLVLKGSLHATWTKTSNW